MISGRQIAAARALLKWTQKDLADRARLSVIAIKKIEAGDTNPRETSIVRIIEAVREAGVEFTQNGGAEYKKDYITIIEGEDCYLRLLDDVFYTLKDDEDKQLLISCADDQVSPREVNAMYNKMRRNGIKMRQLVEEENCYLMGELHEYRYLPKDFFLNRVTLAYGNKVAFVLKNETKITIIEDTDMAVVSKNLFNLLWTLLPKPSKTLADERFCDVAKL